MQNLLVDLSFLLKFYLKSFRKPVLPEVIPSDTVILYQFPRVNRFAPTISQFGLKVGV